jgi:hypothetical protein
MDELKSPNRILLRKFQVMRPHHDARRLSTAGLPEDIHGKAVGKNAATMLI